MNFVSYEQLVADTLALGGRLPTRVRAIAGVNRSGMLPATILATQLHLPLGILDPRNMRMEIPCGGHRLAHKQLRAGDVVFVVDDSAYHADTLKNFRLQNVGSDLKFLCGVVYAHPRHLEKDPGRIDIWQRVVPGPRLFEWNFINHVSMAETMSDVDGVLCLDPKPRDDDGPAYAESLMKLPPLHVPRSVAVHTLITHRLEKHRPATTAWLDKHGARFQRLLMAPYSTVQERREKIGEYGEWKGRQYRDGDCTLFIESDCRQATVIRAVSGKPVLCLGCKGVH